MTIQSKRELEVTRRKLRGLEEQYEKSTAQGDKSYAGQLSLRSLRRLANQLKEEIARFEARESTSTKK